MHNIKHTHIIDIIEKKFDFKVNDNKIFINSLMHPSYINERSYKFSNQRQEYLGDSIIDFLCAEYLYFKFPDELEGFLTKTRATLVSTNALYELSKKLELDKLIILGKGEEMQGGRSKKSNLADAFEAFVCAVYLDQGIVGVKKFFDDNIKPIYEDYYNYFKMLNFDYKTQLQEKTQLDNRKLKYVITKEEGQSHKKTFYVNVEIDGLIYGSGVGSSKKEAEKEAAKNAFQTLVMRSENEAK